MGLCPELALMRRAIRRVSRIATAAAVGSTLIGLGVAHGMYEPDGTIAPPPGSYQAPGPAASVLPGEALERLPYVPGRLVVKLKASVSACVDCLVERRQPLSAALGSDHLDDLNRRYGMRGVHPLRQSYRALKTLAARRALERVQRSWMWATAGQRSGRAAPTPVKRSFAAVYVFELSPWFDMEKVAREYARDAAVVYAEPDRKVRVQLTPNDPYFSSSGAWGQPFDDLWGIKLINAPAAWDTAQGSGVVAAVIDTGVAKGRKYARHAKAMAEATKHAGCQHVIWSTLEDTRRWVPLSDNRMPTLMGKYKVPHLDSKGEADHFFTDLGVPTTFLLTTFIALAAIVPLIALLARAGWLT
jgi:hypothetical protein